VDGFEEIISKFQDYEMGADNEQLLLPGTKVVTAESGAASAEYLIVTLQRLDSSIIGRYRRTKRSGVGFFEQLEAEQRIAIIDGPGVLRYLQELYRRSFVLPSNLRLDAATEFISRGNVHLGVVSGLELKRLFDEYGAALFLENIREYLGPKSGKEKSGDQRETVNEAISASLAQQPDQFLARNNGITFRASRVTRLSAYRLELDDGSIVNGCQTTMSIVRNPQADCHVVVKVVEAQDSWDVAQAANFQNEINRVALKLARYIRPQNIRDAAGRYSVRLQTPVDSSPFSVMDAIYNREITEDEFRALFLALFSKSPRTP
jgi:hypothetical protein